MLLKEPWEISEESMVSNTNRPRNLSHYVCVYVIHVL